MSCILAAPPPIAHALLGGGATVVRILAGDSAPPSPGTSVALRRWPESRSAGRLVVVRSAEQRFGEATDLDLYAEGWSSRSAFRRHWLWRSDLAYREALEVATNEDVDERWAQRADLACLLVTVVPDLAERPRLLAARSEHGYVDAPARALPDEPEAVDLATQTRFTAAARQRDDRRREAAAVEAQVSLQSEIAHLRERVGALRSRSKRAGFDGDARLMELSLRRMEQRVQGST